jgi:hypothetical protein
VVAIVFASLEIIGWIAGIYYFSNYGRLRH